MQIRHLLILSVTTALLAACTESVEPEVELPTAHVKTCYAVGQVFEFDCRGDGYWGAERAPTRSSVAFPLPGVPVRICYFEAFHQCHAREPGHFKVGVTDSEGYAVFPDLEIANYLILPDTGSSVVTFDGCTFLPKDKWGGGLRVDSAYPTTPKEFHNAHIGELWFSKEESCQ